LDLSSLENVENVLAEKWLTDVHSPLSKNNNYIPEHVRASTYECAFAFRRLFASYHDAQVRVKRTSDGRKADLYFDSYGKLRDIFDIDTQAGEGVRGGDDWDGWLGSSEGGGGSEAELDTWFDQGFSKNDMIAFDTVKPRVLYKADEGCFALYFTVSTGMNDSTHTGIGTQNVISKATNFSSSSPFCSSRA